MKNGKKVLFFFLSIHAIGIGAQTRNSFLFLYKEKLKIEVFEFPIALKF